MKRVAISNASLALLGYCGLSVLLAGCQSVPDDYPKPKNTTAMTPAPSGTLANFASAAPNAPDVSSSVLLDLPVDSLRLRLALIDSAQQSLDMQYYIWHGDHVGLLMLYRIYQAADRGVRVRLLVDDLYLRGGDPVAVALDTHPNIEIRVFNAWKRRGRGFAIEYLANRRLNHRMHNKLLVADGLAAIVGGRNIGDEYFGLGEKANFHDMDVALVGPVVSELATAFDSYWNSEWILPATAFDTGMSEEEQLALLRGLAEGLRNDWPVNSISVEPSEWSDALMDVAPKMKPGSSHVLYDRLDGEELDTSTLDGLRDLLLAAEEEVLIANAYLVIGDPFIEAVRTATERGVRVVLMTNSLAANNHPEVHAGYKSTRKKLLAAGAELYEFRADAAVQDLVEIPPTNASSIGLHRKVAVVDSERAFIGSFNFDPRSMYLNSEMGVVIDSPKLASQLREYILRDANPDNAWQLTLNSERKLVWNSSAGEATRDPGGSFTQRTISFIAGFLPIRNQL